MKYFSETASLLIVCGGDNSTVTQASCLQYSIRESQWKPLREMLHTKTMHQSVVVGSSIYVFGGYEHDFPNIMTLPARTKLVAFDFRYYVCCSFVKRKESTTYIKE